MLKSITLFISGFLLLNSVTAQTEYFTGWDKASENAGWSQTQKGVTGFYDWEKIASTSVSPDSCLAHYYPVGGSMPTDNWFISPVFDFSAGGWIDTLWNNYNGFGTPMAGDTIVLYLLNGSSDPDLATKTVLYSFTDSTYMADGVWRELLMIPVGTFAGDSYLAFRYYTTNNWLDVKFDNLKVTSFSNVGLSELSNEIQIYPNPSNSIINIQIDNSLKSQLSSIIIYDMLGNKIEDLDLNLNSVDLSNYSSGTYIIHFTTVNDDIVKQIVVE